MEVKAGEAQTMDNKGFCMLLVVLATILLENNVIACKCPYEDPVEIDYFQADAVFSGTAKEINNLADSRKISALIEIDKIFKGISGNEIRISTNSAGPTCGYPFAVNDKYLIYANGKKNQLETSTCSRTKPILEASKEIDEIHQIVKSGRDRIDDGIHRTYYQNGAVFREISYKDGSRKSEKMYTKTGKIETEFNVVNGENFGFMRRYYDNGNIRYENIVENGKLISEKEYDQNGHLLTEKRL